MRSGALFERGMGRGGPGPGQSMPLVGLWVEHTSVAIFSGVLLVY